MENYKVQSCWRYFTFRIV